MTPLTACGEAAVPTTTTEHVGREVYVSYDCSGCHTTLGAAAVGPTFLGLAGSEVTLSTGEVVVADDDYLRRSIVDPAAQIVEGYEEKLPMPDYFERRLTDEELENVIAYINSLGS
jgi:cytochrome c oxidase subunit 2